MTCGRNSSVFVDCLVIWVLVGFFGVCGFLSFSFLLCILKVSGHRLEVRNWSHIPSVKFLSVFCADMQCIPLK